MISRTARALSSRRARSGRSCASFAAISRSSISRVASVRSPFAAGSSSGGGPPNMPRQRTYVPSPSS